MKALSDAWRGWVVENLLDGVAAAEVIAQLARHVPLALARREVRALAAAPALAVSRQLVARARKLELALALGRAHARGEPRPTEIERRATPRAEEFFRHYWAAHRPVVLTDATRGWPARRWTPAWFRRRFGDAAVTLQETRHQHRRMRLGGFLDRIADGTAGPLYMVSNNRTLGRAAFRPLLADLRPPRELFHLPVAPGAASLWIGPAGTRTPLHHDTTNILFCQLHGRKAVDLIAPHESALVAAAIDDGFYSTIDLDALDRAAHPALRTMLVKRVTLAPGESLFIPAGWWHRVTSLDVSISVSLLGFRRPNDFDWYRPGAV